MPRLDGKVAVITGAGMGIGRAIALRFAEEGARLALIDLDAAALAAILTDVAALGCTAIGQPGDATEEAAAAALTEQAIAAFGQVDIVVNNVGGGRSGRIWDLSVADWDHTMRLSLRSAFLFTRATVPHMIARNYGRVICLSSGARNGTVWNAFHVGACAYATAKAGIHGFIRDLSIELADHGITVNAVAPGPIDTELAGPYLRKMDADKLEYAPSRMTPLHRLGTPREVADAVLFLASDEASYITGVTLDVTGGR